MERDRHAEFLAVALARGAEGGDHLALRQAVVMIAPPHARIGRSREGIVLVVHEFRPDADPRECADRLRAAAATAVGDPSVSAGVGGPRRSAAGAHLAALEAEQALLLGRPLGGEGRTILFADLGPYRFVLGQPAPDLRRFCERVLGPLAATGDPWSEDLVGTLESYLRAHGSVNAVARQLYLHRNTVRHRLRRIAELTGADLGDADSRLALQLAVLGRRALARLAAV